MNNKVIKNQPVKLRSSQGIIDRVVVADLGEILLVCTPDELARARAKGREPKTIGFKRSDMIA